MTRDRSDNTPDLFDGKSTPTRVGSPVVQRVIDGAVNIKAEAASDLGYQHSVLAQTTMPYCNPGDDIRHWDRTNGRVALRIEAGSAFHPEQGFIPVSLPWGPKARLILIHLNGEALRQGSPRIEVEGSLTAFVRSIQSSPPNGRELQRFRNQLTALSTATIRLGMGLDDQRGHQINTSVVTGFDLWAPKDERQRVLWPTTVELSQPYYDSLVAHAVPLDMRAIAALAHSAMALDAYAWMAQRLHRVSPRSPAFVPWSALHWQFGDGFARVRDFRRKFRETLIKVQLVYPDAKVEADNRGLTLRHSPPPVPPRSVMIGGKPR